jgi:hypothetical protein
MVRPELPTQRQFRAPVALVVGGTPELVHVVEEAGLSAQVLVTACPVGEATTVAAEMRPLVMVLREDIYDFDPDSFEALARDVRSHVLIVGSDDPPIEELAAKLKTLMLESDEFGAAWTGEQERR